jgi:hypothetical protein
MQHATRPTKFAKLAMSVKNFTYCAYRKLKSDILDTRKYSTVSGNATCHLSYILFCSVGYYA